MHSTYEYIWENFVQYLIKENIYKLLICHLDKLIKYANKFKWGNVPQLILWDSKILLSKPKISWERKSRRPNTFMRYDIVYCEQVSFVVFLHCTYDCVTYYLFNLKYWFVVFPSNYSMSFIKAYFLLTAKPCT